MSHEFLVTADSLQRKLVPGGKFRETDASMPTLAHMASPSVVLHVSVLCIRVTWIIVLE